MTQQEVVASKAQPRPVRQSGERARFAPNVVSTFTYSLVTLAIGIWFTPYLIHHLGIAIFGIISLADSVIKYLEIFTGSLDSAITRFLAIDLNRDDHSSANRTFNTALFSMVSMAAGLLVIGIPLAFLFPRLLNIPAGAEADASLLFYATILAFGIGLVTSVFAVSSFAKSRFVLSNLVALASVSTRVGFVVLLFYLFQARVWHVSLGFVLAGLVALTGYSILWRRLTPYLRVLPKAFDRTRLRPLLGMSIWLLLNKAGGMLLRNVDLIIVNLAFGSVATGNYGALLPISRNVRSFASAVNTVVNPTLLRKYAQQDIPGLKRITTQSVKLVGLGLALPIGGVIGLSRPFLSIWLGPSFVELTPLLIIMVVDLSINLSVTSMLNVQGAYNKVRWPGIVTLVSGLFNLCLASGFAMWGGLGSVGVALAGTLVWTLKNSLYTPIYTARIMNLPWYTFFPCLLTTVLTQLVVALAGYGLTRVYMPTGWLSLGMCAVIVSAAYFVFVSLFILNREDWDLIKSVIFRRS